MPTIKPSNNPARRPILYWTDDLTHAVKLRNKAKNKMQRTRDLNDRDEYYWLKGVAQRTIKTAKKTYWRDYVSTLDDKSKTGGCGGPSRRWAASVRRHRYRRSLTTVSSTTQTVAKSNYSSNSFTTTAPIKNLTPDFMAHRIKLERQDRNEIHSVAVKCDDRTEKRSTHHKHHPPRQTIILLIASSNCTN